MGHKHTPGPWHVNAVDSRRGRIVGGETTTESYDKLTINSHNATIATVYRPTDARLVAAAPTMLAALQAIVDSLNEPSGADVLAHIEWLASHAIAAAIGADVPA
jgi:hypothetical protein